MDLNTYQDIINLGYQTFLEDLLEKVLHDNLKIEVKNLVIEVYDDGWRKVYSIYKDGKLVDQNFGFNKTIQILYQECRHD